MSKSQSITPTGAVTVLPPEGQLSNTWTIPSTWKSPALGQLHSEDALADHIQQKLDLSNRYGRMSAFVAIQIGIVLIAFRDNSAWGGFTAFMKRRFPKAKSTLYNYMRVAGDFLTEAKLRDRKFKLTDVDAVSPILETQLDLFISPEAQKMQGVLRKLVKWVGDRSLQEIYRNLSHEDDDEDGPPSGSGKGRKKLTEAQEIALLEKEAHEATDRLRLFLGAKPDGKGFEGKWTVLGIEPLAQLDTLLSTFQRAVRDRLQELRLGQARQRLKG